MKTQLINDYQKFADIAVNVSFIMLILLIANIALVQLRADVEPVWRMFRLSVACLPLVIFLPGLRKKRRRTASLLCFALLLYFTVFVSKLGIPGNLVADIISTSLTTLLFISSMMFSTWQYRADLEKLDVKIEGNTDMPSSGDPTQ